MHKYHNVIIHLGSLLLFSVISLWVIPKSEMNPFIKHQNRTTYLTKSAMSDPNDNYATNILRNRHKHYTLAICIDNSDLDVGSL